MIMPIENLILLEMIAGWSIVTCLVYELSLSISKHQIIRVLFSLIISLGFIFLVWAVFFSGKVNWNVEEGFIGISDENIFRFVFILLWICVGFLFSKAFNPSMHPTLRLLLGLICSFLVTNYFMETLYLVYFS
mgnify:CR=1 FL=1|jgi:hypothetical protein